MRFSKKVLFFLGWFSFFLSTIIFSELFIRFIFPYIEKVYPSASKNFPIILLLIFYFFIGFISFIASIKFVIIPPYLNSNIMPGEVLKASTVHYFLKWLEYVVYFLIFSWPLLIKFGYPFESIVRFAWQVLAGNIVYNSVVRSWIEENSAKNPENHSKITDLS